MPAKSSALLFAFLRAINVGGRVVKMVDLKKLFESLKFTNVETYIASGNVIFQDSGRGTRDSGLGTRDSGTALQAIEARLRAALLKKFKYDHTPFVRTHTDLHAIAKYQPFGKAVVAKATGVYVGFLGDAPDASRKKEIIALGNDADHFHVHDREVYWASEIGSGQSKISPKVLERAAGGPVTLRNVRTVLALADKYPL